MPNVLKIPEALHPKYHGAGIALAAVAGGQIVNLAYLRDALADFDDEVDGVDAALTDPRLWPTLRLLQSMGEIHIGMCSCYEFVEL